MKKLFSSILLVLLLYSSACAESEIAMGTPRDTVISQWGEPVFSRIGVDVWCRDGQTLVATRKYDSAQDMTLLTNYVLLGPDRAYISGTIPAENTLFPMYDIIAATPAEEIPTVFDIGSGVVIHAVITADGYIVCWKGDCPNIFLDLDMQFFDCIEQEYFGGNMLGYGLYKLTN